MMLPKMKKHNAGLQLRRAISIQAEGRKLFENHAIAPSAARLCSAAQLFNAENGREYKRRRKHDHEHPSAKQ
jgi:hypothetical protein